MPKVNVICIWYMRTCTCRHADIKHHIFKLSIDSINICINIGSFSQAPHHGTDPFMSWVLSMIWSYNISSLEGCNTMLITSCFVWKANQDGSCGLATKFGNTKPKDQNTNVNMHICNNIIARTFCLNHNKLHCYFGIVIKVITICSRFERHAKRRCSHPTIPWVFWCHYSLHTFAY